MKLSFSTKGWHNRSFEDFCDIAKDLKFKGFELHNIYNSLFSEKDGACDGEHRRSDQTDYRGLQTLHTAADDPVLPERVVEPRDYQNDEKGGKHDSERRGDRSGETGRLHSDIG